MRGRPPLPAGMARSEKIEGRVRPGAAAKFRQAAKERGLTESDALRQALAEWTTRYGGKPSDGGF